MKKQNTWMKVLMVVLAVALIAVVAYIAVKQREYGAGNDFYTSLRGV